MHQVLAPDQRNCRILRIVSHLRHAHGTGMAVRPLWWVRHLYKPRDHVTRRIHAHDRTSDRIHRSTRQTPRAPTAAMTTGRWRWRRGHRKDVVTAQRTVQEVRHRAAHLAHSAPVTLVALVAQVRGHGVDTRSPSARRLHAARIRIDHHISAAPRSRPRSVHRHASLVAVLGRQRVGGGRGGRMAMIVLMIVVVAVAAVLWILIVATMIVVIMVVVLRIGRRRFPRGRENVQIAQQLARQVRRRVRAGVARVVVVVVVVL